MTTANRNLDDIGRDAYHSIAKMTTALECNYDRLEELTDRMTDPDDTLTDDELIEMTELLADAGECESADAARERIFEDPLSIEVRSAWTELGEPLHADEYCILLTTGGPAVRITGELCDGEPRDARLQVQDWGTPWMDYLDVEPNVLMTYVSQFYFGE